MLFQRNFCHYIALFKTKFITLNCNNDILIFAFKSNNIYFSFQKMYENELELFKAADVNGDGALDKYEYPAFSHPEEYEHMHEVRYFILHIQFIILN